jgi:HEAT repeat protein
MTDPSYAEDGNFKRGAVKPIAIVVALALAIGAIVLLVIGLKSDSTKMSVDDIAKARKTISLLPKGEQLPKWRDWAKRTDSDAVTLRQDAFAELAWVRDGDGLQSIVSGLASDDHRVRGTAAQALLEYPIEQASLAKAALLKALGEADDSDKPQICWSLAVIRASEAFDTVLGEYRLGHLAKVQKLDQNPAFDSEILANMVPIEKIASLSADPSDAVRQLVATVLSKDGDAKWTAQLIKLVTDPSVEVAREAAVGLGKIGNEQAMGPLLSALEKADRDSRGKFLEALRDGIGTNGLVLAIKSVSHETPEREKFQTKQLFDMMHELEDPRGADMLAAYIATNPKPHWKTEAALRLAEIGDLRAVAPLAWRLREDPLKLYNNIDDPELRQDDNERVVSARMLADLAVLNPDKLPDIRAKAEDSVLFWVTDKPQPHANGLRFLAAANSTKALPHLRKWSDPGVPLPKEGQQDFPQQWATAQSALRYIGWMRDPPSWGLLEKQLNRRPNKVDATMDSLNEGGLAVLGMTLRALGVGASHGFAQWGDPKAFGSLTKFVEESNNNEQARIEACFSLSWVATDEQMKEIVKKVHDYSKPDAKSAIIRSCYLETLIHRPVPAATAGLLDLLKPDVDIDVRHQTARALGFGGLTKDMITQLQEKANDANFKADATLALLVGADPEIASRALVASYEDASAEAMEELKVIYNQTFGYWSDKNYENGDVTRWIANAEACRHVKVHGVLQDWPDLILAHAIQGIEFDNGPHSMTRVQFRMRLITDAKGGNEAKRTAAIEILKFMKEKGVLMALKSEPPPLGPLARQAFFEVMNPKLTTETVPDSPAAQKGKTGSGMPH